MRGKGKWPPEGETPAFRFRVGADGRVTVFFIMQNDILVCEGGRAGAGGRFETSLFRAIPLL